MTENEFLLEDRLGVIRDTIKAKGEENFYLAYSGGKDSTVVHHLLDMALPGNTIPRVFSNTGIEYNLIVQFVKEIADERFVMIYSKQNIKQTLERVGYPFKSKEHSTKVGLYQRGSRSKSVEKYINAEGKKTKYCCPDILKYQFTGECNLKISEQCCNELKKKPVKEYEKQTGRTIGITGMMREEKGQREFLNCVVTKNGKMIKFHPLAKVSKEWEEWFIEKFNVRLCPLYYEPYNFTRTGCKGCPFSLSLSL